MTDNLSLNELWNTSLRGERTFNLDQVTNLPEAARRYLQHAITPGTKLRNAVRLHMHGEIKLQRWFPFRAEQVIRYDRGMIWNASVSMLGIPVRGFDRIVDGEGSMRWKLLGIVPVITASGPDITRSAAGRLAAELVWLPSALVDNTSWTATNASNICVRFTVQSEHVKLSIFTNDHGCLRSFKMQRWGNPAGSQFRYVDFGGIVEEEATFEGYTIPIRLRVGWYYGTEKFESEGEFLRVVIDSATYR